MSSPMSQQLREDQVLARRLDSTWQQVVILERLARSGGAAKWFLARCRSEIEQLFDALRGGSCVTFYFANYLHVETDNAAARQRMFEEITSHGELILGYPITGSVEFTVEIISGPSELSEFLMLRPEGALAVWGSWPPRANDGQNGITANLVDADGILRPHPH